MKYTALLRGINVGGHHRVEMKKLTLLFEQVLGYTEVSTYINSGNIMFEASDNKTTIQVDIESCLKQHFKFDIPTLLKTHTDMRRIARAIPASWHNDPTQRTDVAYLFPHIDHKQVIAILPIRREYIDIRYVPGALIWNILRANYTNSHLHKLISHELYQYMTIRNVNTARFLGDSPAAQ